MRRIVGGQKVNPAKAELAQRLRGQMTPEEVLLWERLRGDKIGFHFRRQQVIDGFIVDFYCHSADLIVEVDGSVHLQQADYDVERDKILRLRDLRILRITNDEVVSDLAGVVERIRAECEAVLEE